MSPQRSIKNRKGKVSREKTAPKSEKKRKTTQIRKTTRTRRRAKSQIVTKGETNPIISPNRRNGWEAWQTFNPGAILLDRKVHFVYRAVGHDGISRFGYARSSDGFTVEKRLSYPIFEHSSTNGAFSPFSFASGWRFGGAEDPRLTRVDSEDVLYMTYTACEGGLRVGLVSISIDDFLHERFRWRMPRLISPPHETHKNWVLFPQKIKGKYAILHSIHPDILIDYFDDLSELDGHRFIHSCYDTSAAESRWDSHVRGAGPPPLETKDGWLLFYHAIDNRDQGRYKIGAMLLDFKDPTHILYRLSRPILEPDESYENDGFKSGIVYASGAVVKDGMLLIYYGGSDTYVCVASAKLDAFLENLRNDTKPHFERNVVKKK